FVPKIPSVRIVDVAKAMAPDLPTTVVGIRPGEKLHEVMCPTDDSHLTLDFHDHYVIRPTIKFHHKEVDYAANALGETGREVASEFEYQSGTNERFLDIDEIRRLNHLIGL